MQMTYNSKLKRFEVYTSYQEYMAGHVDKVKAAGFRFDRDAKPKCWYTEDPSKASLLIICADEVAKNMLQDRAISREKALTMSRAEDADLGDRIADLGLEPYPFQRAGIAYALERDAVLFGDEPGLGKTIQALATTHIRKAYPAVCVVPATLKINWRKEGRRICPELGADGAIQILAGETPYALTDPRVLVYVVNYDILQAWLPHLTTLGLKTVILDESHFAMHYDAQRTRACIELATGVRFVKEKGKKLQKIRVSQPIKYRYLLTGTPEPNRPAELEPQLEILGVLDLFGGTWGFKKRFCKLTEKWIWRKNPKTRKAERIRVFEYKGATNTDELQRLLREYVMVRRLKDDVLTELPPKRHQAIEIAANGDQDLVDRENQLEEDYVALVERLKQQIIVATDSGDQATFEKATQELQKVHKAHFTEMAKLAHDVALAKIPKTVQFALEVLESGEKKVAVFAHHHDVELALEKAFQAAGLKTVRLTGKETAKQKDAAVEQFQEGDAQVFIGALKCGIGYTITAASRVIMAELDWTPGVMDQAADRLHRIGQTDSVLVTYLVYENSLDAKKVGMLVSKREVARKVLDAPLEGFQVPVGMPQPKAEKPQLPPDHVMAILERIGVKLEDAPF